MQFKTGVQIAMGVTGFAIWTYAAYHDPALQSDYLKFVQGAVIGISALALRDMQPSQPKDQPEQPKEDGKKDEVSQ